jgi:uncharacterized protein
MVEEVRVNFGKPIALFPLDAPVLFPQQLLQLHIFEPRYRQMVQHALDGSGQFAMAVLAKPQTLHAALSTVALPPLRGAVCLGQIVKHDRTADGRYLIVVQGICRAHILQEAPPREERLYREALLTPTEAGDAGCAQVVEAKSSIEGLLKSGELSKLRTAEALRHLPRDFSRVRHPRPYSRFFPSLRASGRG